MVGAGRVKSCLGSGLSVKSTSGLIFNCLAVLLIVYSGSQKCLTFCPFQVVGLVVVSNWQHVFLFAQFSCKTLSHQQTKPQPLPLSFQTSSLGKVLLLCMCVCVSTRVCVCVSTRVCVCVCVSLCVLCVLRMCQCQCQCLCACRAHVSLFVCL